MMPWSPKRERRAIVAHLARCSFCRALLEHGRRRADLELLAAAAGRGLPDTPRCAARESGPHRRWARTVRSTGCRLLPWSSDGMKTEDELERSRAAREKAMRALRRRHPHLPAPTSSIDLAAIRASIRRAVDEDQAARSGSDGMLRVSAVLSL